MSQDIICDIADILLCFSSINFVGMNETTLTHVIVEQLISDRTVIDICN